MYGTIARLRQQMRELERIRQELKKQPDQQLSLTDPTVHLGSSKKGLFEKRDFVYVTKDDEYRCPAGERDIRRFTTGTP